MKEISIAECQTILLNIVSTVDAISKKHNIPYYMLSGTMLGAVRHKGFIPWDDDIDIGVPRNQYYRLKEVLKKELPKEYRLLSLNHSRKIMYGFSKIEYTQTLALEKGIQKHRNTGISVDIFPLDGAANNKLLRQFNVSYINTFLKIYTLISFQPELYKQRHMQVLAKLVQKLPINPKRFINYIDALVKRYPYRNSKYVANYYGKCGNQTVMPKHIYGSPTSYVFENLRFTGPENYDAYLKHFYGNYELVPEPEKRRTHFEKILAYTQKQ